MWSQTGHGRAVPVRESGGRRMELAVQAVAVEASRPPARARRHRAAMGTGEPGTVQVEIVVPVYNEACQLADRITELRAFLDESLPFSSLVTIVDNGSTDGTALAAQRLAASVPGVETILLRRKGRGYALRCAWLASTAEVVAYMDVDLSTSLCALMPLVASVLSGHGDVAVGTRLARGSRVVRGPKRELISRAYNLVVRASLHSRVSDFQCGFKALRRERALELLPFVEDDSWFFDTELLVTAERLGLRITEIPVDWVDDPDSRVHIVSTAIEDVKGIWRMARRRTPQTARHRAQRPDEATQATADELFSFAGLGALSTLSYLLLFFLGVKASGPWVSNAFALAVTTVVNTALHRSLASARLDGAGGAGGPGFFTVATALFGVSLTCTTGALLLADALAGPSMVIALIAVTVANAVASLARFVLLRSWAFRPQSVAATR